MGGEPRRYVFAPLEHRGLVAGLSPAQVAMLGGGLVVATAIVRMAPSPAGVVTAIVVMLVMTAASFTPVAGRPVEQWAPAAARRVLIGHRHRPPPVLHPPLAFRSIGFEEVDGVAVVCDRRAATLTAVLPVRGRSFALLDAADKERRLASWSAVLSGLSREGSPIRSLQWVERIVPGDADELARHFESMRTIPAGAKAARSYAALVAEAGPLGQEHECFVALTLRMRRRRTATTPQDALLRELSLLHGQLRAADLDAGTALGVRQLGAAVRAGFDPWARRWLAQRDGCLPAAAWPVGADEGWAAWHTDDCWHATYWLGEWPRSDVGPDFLAPLLLHTTCQRTLAVTMAPLPPSAGIREAEAALTAQAADEQLRQEAGFLATARRRRQAEGIARRETELSDGHAAYRFSGYVTVTAHDPEQLEIACGEIVQAAHQCRLEPRRLFGVQDVAFSWTLPLGRGIAGR
jgi:hypothetical protein